MAFATPTDVATRLGRALTGDEAGQAEFLLQMATGAIAAAADKNDAWANSYTPPRVIKLLAIELVVRTLPNPGGLRSRSKTLGQFQSSESFADPGNGGGILLSDLEERLVRRVVYGRTSGSARTESIAHDVLACGGS